MNNYFADSSDSDSSDDHLPPPNTTTGSSTSTPHHPHHTNSTSNQIDAFTSQQLSTINLLRSHLLLSDHNLIQQLFLQGLIQDLLGLSATNSQSGPPPASKEFIATLKPPPIAPNNDAKCPICTEVLTLPRELPCTHIFDLECIVPWLELRNTCPVCRFELPTDVQEQQNPFILDDDEDDQHNLHNQSAGQYSSYAGHLDDDDDHENPDYGYFYS